MKYYTYVHTSKLTGKIFYVGKGSGDRLKITRDRSSRWKEIAKKEGWDSLILGYWSSEEDAFEHEKFLIFCLRDMGVDIVNIHDGGCFYKGIQPTREVICTSHGVSFKSCTDAALWAGKNGYEKVNRSAISSLCKSGKKRKGFTFAYADGTPYVVEDDVKFYRIPVGTTNTGEPHISWHEDRNYFIVYFSRNSIRSYFSPGVYGNKDIAFNAALDFKYSLYHSIYDDVSNKADHFPLMKEYST